MKTANVLIALLLTAMMPMMASTPSRAQVGDVRGQSYITPFPEGDTYRVVVIGDWLAEGLVGSFADTMQGDQRTQVQRKARALSGLSKPEGEEEVRTLEDQIARETIHIAVVFVGGGDRISYRATNGKRIPVGSEEWRAEYGRRVDRLMKVLKKRNIAVYWVGQPILRRSEADDDAQVMNEIMRERANMNGLRFIDIHAAFAEDGSYSAHGPDLSGKIRVLRASDGIGFTPDGYRKLAHFVERDVKRDITQAKSERNIPLAGSEAEQRKINPDKAAGGAAPPVASAPLPGMASKGAKAAATNWITSTATTTTAVGPAPNAGDQRAENGRVTIKTAGPGGREETITLDIIRPPIPATVLAAVTRKETAEKASQMGETVTDAVSGGVLVMSSVTPLADSSGRRGRQNPTQATYYRVLVKGDRIPSKPGRADDHSWPRTDAVADVPPPAPGGPARTDGRSVEPVSRPMPGRAQPRG